MAFPGFRISGPAISPPTPGRKCPALEIHRRQGTFTAGKWKI